MRPKIYLKKNEEKRIKKGHPWIFSNEVSHLDGNTENGGVVEVYDYRKKFLAVAYFNPHSLIALRVLSVNNEAIDKNFFEKRIKEAFFYREKVLGERDAFRVVFGEGDKIPGLIADKYGPFLILQFLTLGIEKFSEDIIEIFQNLLEPRAIILRNDSPFRKLEGLRQEKKLLGGNLQLDDISDLFIHEDTMKFKVDIWNGQKTGFFLDQRDNRDYFSDLKLTGEGLDCFSYSGAWGVRGAACASVTCVDSSEGAISLVRLNGELNGCKSLSCVREDVFKYLDTAISQGKKFDWINLDPPAFVKNKKSLKQGISGYKNINRKAMKLLRKGGILITSSCSYNLSGEHFVKLLNDAALEAKKAIRVISYKGQSRDHPILLSMPESEYLKCFFLQIS